jgi:glycerophosphoryl diester phosphodiesterase
MTDIASHRGGALLWPENSRIAFENTARLNVEQVEFDVHPSQDGQLVVIHDATLDRATDGTGPVAAQDWSVLQKLVLRSAEGQRMLLLDEVIDIFKPTPILLRLEIKPDHNRRLYPNHAGKIVETLRRRGVLERTIITSFQVESLVEVAAHGRPRERIWLVAPDVQRDIGGVAGIVAVARAHDIGMVGLNQRVLDRRIVMALREVGVKVGGWACNDADSISRMFALGIDVFTTDRPDLAIAARAALAARSAPKRRNSAA